MPFALSSKLRQKAPSPLDLRHEQVHSSLPTPPAESKMFSWKKKSTTPVLPVFPSEPPRPILKTRTDTGGPSIRFVGTPAVVVSQYDPQPMCELPRTAPRRSSRPTSPSTSSFGARVALATPPLPSHVTTPPTAYVSSMQTRAPPPPSPYRPTHERSRSARALPSTNLFASESTVTLDSVPMLNIIPATPQDSGEEFWVAPRRSRLEEAVRIEEMEEVPLIDVALDFSPFTPLASLPDSQSHASLAESHTHPSLYESQTHSSLSESQTDPSLPSPPFESFSSLPSLGSDDSMPSSASNSSLISFPDVEEALGSMLASLSDKNIGLGLGLGLGLDMYESGSITAPLSPRRRPLPLDLSEAKRASGPTQQSAPPNINHRVAFYGTARIHPNSPTSGVFTLTHSPHASLDSEPFSNRDSLSLASEASDDDLHTASIISLTPVLGERAVRMGLREDLVEVGLAL